MLPIVLLPGMDGTGALFRDFVAMSPPDFRPLAVPLPAQASYDELTASIAELLPRDDSFAIIAESFSGPIGIRLAERFGDRVLALVLVNSFCTPPRSPIFRFLPWKYIFAVPPPRWVVRWLLVGKQASDRMVDDVRSAVAATDRAVMAARVRAVLTVNEIDTLGRLQCPVLLLRGTEDALVTSRIGQIETTDIPAPHVLLHVRPREAWSAIEAFLRRSHHHLPSPAPLRRV